jgi:hypothetical protein
MTLHWTSGFCSASAAGGDSLWRGRRVVCTGTRECTHALLCLRQIGAHQRATSTASRRRSRKSGGPCPVTVVFKSWAGPITCIVEPQGARDGLRRAGAWCSTLCRQVGRRRGTIAVTLRGVTQDRPAPRHGASSAAPAGSARIFSHNRQLQQLPAPGSTRWNRRKAGIWPDESCRVMCYLLSTTESS